MAKVKKEKVFHFFGVELIEKIIELLKRIFSKNLLEFCIKWAAIIGHYGFIIAAGIGFLFSFIVAIKINSFRAFLVGIIWVLLVFVVQFTAKRFGNAGAQLLQNNPSELSSVAFLDCVGFLAAIAGIISFIYSIINSIQLKSLQVLLTGLGIFIILEIIALVTFNPKEITISITNENSAGQEALCILTYFLKLFLKIVPVLFGIGIAVGTIILFIDFLGVFGDNIAFKWTKASTVDSVQILSAGLLPFVSYIIFVFYYLIIDIIKAILSIPNKLDNLKK